MQQGRGESHRQKLFSLYPQHIQLLRASWRPPHQSCLSSLATVALQPVRGGFSAAKNFIQLFIHSGGGLAFPCFATIRDFLKNTLLA